MIKSEGVFKISVACLLNSVYSGKHVSAVDIIVTGTINKKWTTCIIEKNF